MPAHPSPDATTRGLTRRALLADGAGALAASSLAPAVFTSALRPRRRVLPARSAGLAEPTAAQAAALEVLGRTTLRQPDSLPDPTRPSGSDLLPGVEHIVVLMLENHSYDNFLGMLGRGAGQQPRGDGFALAADGRPTATNPYADGRLQRAFRMPTTCQLPSKPSQEWAQSHIQYADGKNNGFVVSDSGPVAMGYWGAQDLPFTYDLAGRFPLADRWFASCLGQTDPQRRFLIAGTAAGQTDDIGTGPGNAVPDATLGAPTNGTIFERLSAAGVSWYDYNHSFPTGATMELYPTEDTPLAAQHQKPIEQFYSDAAAGTLPAFSLLDPNFETEAQENPQNIVLGDALLARVLRTLGSSRLWPKTLFVLCYDEHGGYYDHVPPPVALAPDAVPPTVQPGEASYEGYARYGFRVPAVVVSPYARPGHVSHTVYDHTSILALVERKWNLPAMTLRDANANDLTDMLDLAALAAGRPTFPELPTLATDGENAATLACSSSGPGTIPPPDSILPAGTVIPPAGRHRGAVRGRRRGRRGGQVVIVRWFGRHHPAHGAVLDLRATHGTLRGLVVELRRGAHLIARARVAHVGGSRRRVVLHAAHGPLGAGNYALEVRHGSRVLERRTVHVG